MENEYLGELRRHWRPLLAAFVGMGTGCSSIGYVTSVFAPSLISDNGWTLADFAKIGSYMILQIVILPFIGRFADVLGVRNTALFGLIGAPVAYLAYSMMGGSIWVYTAIYLIHNAIGLTTTATVYTRLVVQHVQKARGIALAIAASGPAVFGGLGAPILNDYVDAAGWRAGFHAIWSSRPLRVW